MRRAVIGPAGCFLFALRGSKRWVKRSENGRVGEWLRGRWGNLGRVCQ